jgi:hypothetical protein
MPATAAGRDELTNKRMVDVTVQVLGEGPWDGNGVMGGAVEV